jgi:diguanylate cyclase (GGDEF)-like protein
LTALPNRRLFEDRFKLAMAYADSAQAKVALLFLDLDNFKTINDSLGHAIGDSMIRELAGRLKQCVSDTDTVSRQGGDEFLILLPNLPDVDATAPIVVKIMACLQEPCEIDGHELNTSVSVGVAMYPDDGADFDSLMKKADMAMYRAKDAGRNAYRFFDEQMNIEALEQLSMRSGLHRALARNEFVLHYQPQIDLASGKLVGVEALLRWQHPESSCPPHVSFR